MLNVTGLLTVKQRIWFNVILLIYKARKGLLPKYLAVNISRVGDVQPYNLRNNDLLKPVSSMNTVQLDSIWYKGINVFNEMSRTCNTNCDNISDFKKMTILFVKQKFSDV